MCGAGRDTTALEGVVVYEERRLFGRPDAPLASGASVLLRIGVGDEGWDEVGMTTFNEPNDQERERATTYIHGTMGLPSIVAFESYLGRHRAELSSKYGRRRSRDVKGEKRAIVRGGHRNSEESAYIPVREGVMD
jgi:hypothetical protein